MSISPLPPSTIKLIGSSQVITSVSSVIKELMENSIDSGALNIEIRLEKNGFEKIEVKDDGCGVDKNSAMVMCLRSYTSKIADFSDLDKLSSYGFRGEALSSLCNVAKVNVTTKTADEDVATCYTYDNSGQVTCLKISHISKGTIVSITELFKNLPVRKQFMSNSKRASEELKKVEKVVKSLAMVHPRMRVTLIHNKFMIWQKTSVTNLRQSVMQVITLNIVKQLYHILHNTDQIRIEMLVPTRDCNISSVCYSHLSESLFLFVNKRPVRNKELEKAVYDKFSEYFGIYIPVNKKPVCVMSVTLSPDSLDVNLEPNKTQVLIKNEDEIVDIIKQCMFLYYTDKKTQIEDKECDTKPTKKRKLETADFDPKDSFKEHVIEDKHFEESTEINMLSSQSNLENECVIPSVIHTLKNNLSEEGTVTSNIEKCNLKLDRAIKEPIKNETNKNESISNESDKSKEVYSNSENIGDILDINDSHRVHTPQSDANSYCKMLDFPFHSKMDNDNVSSNNNIEGNMSSENKQSTDLLNPERTCQSADTKGNNKDMTDIFFNPVISNTFSLQNVVDSCSPAILVLEKDDLANSVCMSRNINELDRKETNQINDGRIFDTKTNSTETVLSRDCDVLLGSCSPTISQWSRGEVTSSTGNIIKGPCVLDRNVDPSSPQPSQGLSNRSVSSQMGCKELSAFTKFARDMRKKIIEEQPGINFTKVAQLLQVRWRHLDENERKKYVETRTIKKIETQNKTSPNKTLEKHKSGIEIDIDLSSLKEIIKRSTEMEERGVHLIGQLEASTLWLFFSQASEITVVSTSHLLETVKFHQWLNSYALSSKVSDSTIPLSASTLGQSSWNTLISLERSPNGIITDPRIVSNGFHVEINRGDLEGCISYVPEHISECGIAQLKEILQHLQTHGPQATLSQCRPLSTVSFIKDQVMRECNGARCADPQQVSELLSYWMNHVASENQSCFHGRPISLALAQRIPQMKKQVS